MGRRPIAPPPAVGRIPTKRDKELARFKAEVGKVFMFKALELEEEAKQMYTLSLIIHQQASLFTYGKHRIAKIKLNQKELNALSDALYTDPIWTIMEKAYLKKGEYVVTRKLENDR